MDKPTVFRQHSPKRRAADEAVGFVFGFGLSDGDSVSAALDDFCGIFRPLDTGLPDGGSNRCSAESPPFR